MKITNARVVVCSPGRNFVTLIIETEGGITGIGDATLNGREMAVASYLQDHVIPLIIGRDSRRIEDTWHYLYKGAYWRRGPVTMAAISAVDVALWDIKAKMANMPLYQLLGGRSRERVLVYGHANGKDLDETLVSVENCVKQGFLAVRVQCGIPGYQEIYGINRGEGVYEPAEKGAATEERWSTPDYLAYLPTVFRAVRKEFGPSLHLLHDCHHRLTPNEAAQLGKELEPFKLFWMEDPTPAENQACFSLIRSRTTIPIAVGEVFNTIWDAKTLIEKQLIDYIRSSILHAGGITHTRIISMLADLYQVRTGFHGATDLSPITFGAAVHFDTWVPNFGIQELMEHSSDTRQVFTHSHGYENGYLLVSEDPGHGVTFNEESARRFPYERAYLPTNRLTDGTVWSW